MDVLAPEADEGRGRPTKVLWELSNRAVIRGVRMGKPSCVAIHECMGVWEETWEVKHLSTHRKKTIVIP